LLVHSPIKISDRLKSEINAIGAVNYVIAPNKWHHLFVGNFKAVYPEAKFFCAPGLEKKRSDFKFDDVINKDQNYPWNNYVSHKLVEGVPIFNEVVFFHPQSKTLILTDLALHICDSPSFLTRMAFKLIGGYGKFGWAKLEKKIYIKDKQSFQKSIHSILEWDFDRVLLTHGKPVNSGGKPSFKEAYL
jgi:hypothetical protein